MSVSPSTSTVSNARKRCELACRPCRHRKIKCQNSMPNQPTCDSCRAKGKDPNECRYIPVAEDSPPIRPRQSPPAAIHPIYGGYNQGPPISPIRETHPIPHSSPSSTGYYSNAYPHYQAPQASPPHYSQPPSVQLHTIQPYSAYTQPASPGQTYVEAASGMVAPEGDFPWSGQLPIQSGYGSPGPVSPSIPVGQDVWPGSAPDQMQDTTVPYYDPVPSSPVASYAPYQQPSPQYQQPSPQYQYTTYSSLNGGSYYPGSP